MNTVVVCTVLLASASSSADPSPLRPFAEAGLVIAKPQSNLDNLDPGVGLRVVVGVQGASFGGWIGYRRIWSGNDDFDPTNIWTVDVMGGARVTVPLAHRLRAELDAYVAVVSLDSENEKTGLTNGTWHHSGTGAGGRLGARYRLATNLEAAVAVGESYAETHYDDDMGVAWLSIELSVAGTF